MAHSEMGPTKHASARFTKRAMAVPLLAAEKEFELARRWKEQGDEAALHELTTAYMRLVVSVASRFRAYGLPHSDLVQEGCVGLMQAASRFEPERGIRFSTYAGWWIRAAAQDYVLRNWSIVRTGTTSSQKSLFFNLRRLRAKIDNGTGENLSSEARTSIAQQLNVSVGDVETMEMRFQAGDRSLNAGIGSRAGEEEVAEWQDLLVDERPKPDEVFAENHDAVCRREWIGEALKALNTRELKIIKARRLTEDPATLEQLGQKLGVSKERVRQIEHQALKKLRDRLLAIAEDPAEMGLIAG